MELHSIIFLLTILSVIFLLTFFIHHKQKRKLHLKLDKQEPRFDVVNHPRSSPVMSQEVEEEEVEEVEEEVAIEEDDDLLNDPLLQPRGPVREVVQPTAKKPPAPDELMLIMLAAKPEKPYAGYELLQALLTAGLRFGAQDFFHRYEDANGKGRILFSVVSASEAGTFEINKMGAYSGKGLMMFMRLANHKDVAASFEAMIETARQLVEDLDGEILDEERKVLTNEKIEKMRKKALEFEQKQLTGDLFDQ